eukprot:COSAG02_NODE_332_length_24474_cov_23.190949_11_plen_48_part_00
MAGRESHSSVVGEAVIANHWVVPQTQTIVTHAIHYEEIVVQLGTASD